MSVSTPEGGDGVEEEITKNSREEDDPGRRGAPAEGQILELGCDGVHGQGGDPAGDQEKKEVDLSIDGRATSSDGYELGEEKSEEDDASAEESFATSTSGDSRVEGNDADTGHLRDAIENADVRRLERLLTGEQAKALLQQTYGGHDGGLDEIGLFSRTLPLLHAAKNPSQNPEPLRRVLVALKGNDLLQEQLLETDSGGRTVLHLAALSGSHSTLRDIVLCCETHLRDSQVYAMLTSRDTAASRRTVLMMAAASGSSETFEASLKAAKDVLDRRDHNRMKLKRMLMLQDLEHQTLLQLAAHSGSKDAVKAVWEACRERGIKATEFRVGGTTGLMKAVEDIDIPKFERVLREAKANHLKIDDIVSCKNVVGETILSKAVESGDVDLFEGVRKRAWAVLSPIQRGTLVESKNIFGEPFLAKAFDTGDKKLFKAVLECAWEVLDHHQLIEFIRAEDLDGKMTRIRKVDRATDLCQSLIKKAIGTKDVGIVEAAVNCVKGRCPALGSEWLKNEIRGRKLRGRKRKTDVGDAMEVFRDALFDLTPMMIECSSSGRKIAEGRSSEMDEVFSVAAGKISKIFHEDSDVRMLFSLIANSARPSASIIKELSLLQAGDVFKRCCLQAVTSAANPFISGITLSIRLSEAAKQAGEGDRRTLWDSKSSIDELLLEIFERLPQTVLGFEEQAKQAKQANMFHLTNILEPKLMRARSESNGLGGPLDMIISEPQQLETFCKVPLVMDFLSSKFTQGLPNLVDTAEVLRTDLWRLEEGGFVVHGFEAGRRFSKIRLARQVAALLQGVDLDALLDDTPQPPPLAPLTFLPGAQFIVAGIVAAPADYYHVPAVRMLLDFVVYVGTVAALSYFVLFQSTTGRSSGFDGILDHRFSLSEGACALIFIMAGVYREGREMKRGIRTYFKDQWNVLDALGIFFMFVGMFIRWDDWTSTWGAAFYALSAPLLVSRVLFFAQILHFQGPMIQVIFRMTATLLQFGAVMLVVMVGFTMALHVLFRDLEDFGDTLLGLFKAMLGDTDFFDKFSGGRYDTVATILVVVYLFIVTIMLLNLLIAILSTAHAQVQENTGGAFKVSKARIIAHYRLIVDEDVLPAPFNLVQLLLSLVVIVVTVPCYFIVEATKEYREAQTNIVDGRVFWGNVWKGARRRHRCARRGFGHLVFRLVLGSAAVAGGGILWALSGLSYAQYVWHLRHPGTRSVAEVGKKGICFLPLSRVGQGLLILAGCVVEGGSAVLVWVLMLCWCILGAPFCLFLGWVGWGILLPVTEICRKRRSTQSPFGTRNKKPSNRKQVRSPTLKIIRQKKLGRVGRFIQKHFGTSKMSSKRVWVSPPTIESMLKKNPGGVGAGKLLTFLENPMEDKNVRQDEKGKKTTVEHIKLLRDYLEFKAKDALEELRKDMASKNEVQQIRDL